MIKRLPRIISAAVVIFVLGNFSVPIVGGVWYMGCGDRYVEQEWLNRATSHLKLLRAHCSDPDLQNVLDYAIRRYNKVGAVGRDGHAAGQHTTRLENHRLQLSVRARHHPRS